MWTDKKAQISTQASPCRKDRMQMCSAGTAYLQQHIFRTLEGSIGQRYGPLPSFIERSFISSRVVRRTEQPDGTFAV